MERTRSSVSEFIRSAVACVGSATGCSSTGEGSILALSTQHSALWRLLAGESHDGLDGVFTDHIHAFSTLVSEVATGIDGTSVQSCCRDGSDRDLLVTIQCEVDVMDKRLIFSLTELWLVIYPLCWLLVTSCCKKYQECRQRYIVGVGGAAGSGKSSLCTVLGRLITTLTKHKLPQSSFSPLDISSVRCSVMGQDAYHLPNEELKERCLQQLKGSTSTFNVESFVADVTKLTSTEAGTLKMPAYSREVHEPLADQVEVWSAPCVVLVEGVHALCTDAPFTALQPLWDLKVYVDCAESVAKPRAILRKMRGCRERRTAEQHYERVDAVNRAAVEKPVNVANCDVRLSVRPTQDPDCSTSMSTEIINVPELSAKVTG
ncbi:uncharacterized protein LOC135824517 [Sycon ciliatum]|uniref:uncharacterized protein LOC135824517 n=1 Tax=Sycon ciliatum TaxID=27933 RepID=UPI0031F6E96F